MCFRKLLAPLISPSLMGLYTGGALKFPLLQSDVYG